MLPLLLWFNRCVCVLGLKPAKFIYVTTLPHLAWHIPEGNILDAKGLRWGLAYGFPLGGGKGWRGGRWLMARAMALWRVGLL